MRKVVVSVAATAGTLGFALFTGCSGSNSAGPTDGGHESGTIMRRPDGGTGGGGFEAGVGVVPPSGTQVVSSPSAYLEGLTDDGYAIYQDTVSNALYAASIAKPNAAPITITTDGSAYMAGLAIVGKSVVMLSGSTTSRVGSLATWTFAGGIKTISLASTLSIFDITNDGSKIVYYDNASETGGSLTTGDLTVSSIDGTGKNVLAKGVTLQGGPCQLPSAQVAFIGTDLVGLSCSPMTDAGAMPGDAGDGGGGAAGPSETLTLYSGPSWTGSVVTTDISYGSTFGSDRGLGKAGTQVLFLTSAGLVNYVVGPSSMPTLITSDSTYTGSYSADGSQILYVTQAGAVVVAPAATPSSMTILTTGRFNYIVGQSPDPKSKFAIIATAETRDPMSNAVSASDMFLLSTAGVNSPSPISMGSSAAPYGQAFTADSNYAVFDDNVSGGVGTLYVQPTSGSGNPVAIGQNSWIDDEPKASFVVFNVNCGNCTTMYVPGTADIQYLDLAQGMTPTTLVTQADYNFYLTLDKTKLVYSWHPTTSGPDAGASKAGVWVWPLP
jgi:hypothetical protein